MRRVPLGRCHVNVNRLSASLYQSGRNRGAVAAHYLHQDVASWLSMTSRKGIIARGWWAICGVAALLLWPAMAWAEDAVPAPRLVVPRVGQHAIPQPPIKSNAQTGTG